VVDVSEDHFVCGPDDPSRPAGDVLRSMSPIHQWNPPADKKVYVIGFNSVMSRRRRR